jgi:hypothetical protein
MKKVFFLASALSLMITQTGCFGSFSLIKKVHEFNDSVVDNEILKTLLFYVLNFVPVYSVAGFLDVVIFNLLEFWTGSNPISMEPGQMEEQLIKFDGVTYKVTATQNNMAFVKLEGGKTIDMGSMNFDTDNYAWSFEKDGEVNKLVSFDVANNQLNYYTSNGITSVDAEAVKHLALEKSKLFTSEVFLCN